MKKLQNAKENLRLLKNKIRMWFLKRFTDRVKVITIKDPNTGKDFTMTTESQTEKVCQHTKIQQVYGTFWKCMDCKGLYFEITYKVAVTRTDLIGFLEAIATDLQIEVEYEADKKPNADQPDTKSEPGN